MWSQHTLSGYVFAHRVQNPTGCARETGRAGRGRRSGEPRCTRATAAPPRKFQHPGRPWPTHPADVLPMRWQSSCCGEMKSQPAAACP
eukprot:765452-Prymnesium_polylepis.2